MKKIIGITVLIIVFVLGIGLGIYLGRQNPPAPKQDTAKIEKIEKEAKKEVKRPKLVRYKVMLKDLKRFKVKKN